MASRTRDVDMVVCPASAEHSRQTEASILPFEDGRLFLAYSDFCGPVWLDRGTAQIMGRWSHDEGETWSEPFLVQENIGKTNVMSASLLRLPSGRVLLGFMRKDFEPHGEEGREMATAHKPDQATEDPRCPGGLLHEMVKHSDDECRTWSEPVNTTQGDSYWCSNNDRFLRLSTGRILMPIGEHANNHHAWYSDDDGATWTQGVGMAELPNGAHYHASGAKMYGEPVAVELADGTVAMFIRNSSGRIHIAHSRDHGETWTLVETDGPNTCNAPCIVRRVPGSDDLLLIWNNNAIRSSLTAAVSRDSGRSWANYRLLEEQEDWPMSRSYAYPSLAFLNGNAHITYWETHTHPTAERLFHLVYRRLPISWFYEDRTHRPPVCETDRSFLSTDTVYDGEELREVEP